eukprot:scaffold316735_cov30-Tisochrysis_lutea.AAC.1
MYPSSLGPPPGAEQVASPADAAQAASVELASAPVGSIQLRTERGYGDQETRVKAKAITSPDKSTSPMQASGGRSRRLTAASLRGRAGRSGGSRGRALVLGETLRGERAVSGVGEA